MKNIQFRSLFLFSETLSGKHGSICFTSDALSHGFSNYFKVALLKHEYIDQGYNILVHNFKMTKP